MKIPEKINPDDLVLEWGSHQSVYREPGMQEWVAEVAVMDEDHEESQKIGSVVAHVVDSDLLTNSLFEVLDSVSADLCVIAEGICDGEYLHSDLEIYHPFVILDSIELDPAVRGQGLGPIVASMAISYLGIGCGVAFAYPAPQGEPQYGKTREQAVAALERTWAKVGFRPVSEGAAVWMVDVNDVESRCIPV